MRRGKGRRVPAVPQAGAVPFKVLRDGRVRVLLITTSAGGWGMPKGKIDRGHTAPQTALKESCEEAGIRGSLGRRELGGYEYGKNGKRHHVRVFPLRVARLDRRWPEQGKRRRRWTSLAAARREAHPPGLRELLASLQPAVLRTTTRR